MSLASACNRVVTLPRLAIAVLLLLGLVLFRDTWNPSSYIPVTKLASSHDNSDYVSPQPAKSSSLVTTTSTLTETCGTVPGADKVLVLLKTGATELYSKLPTHLVTLFKCTPHYMLFSDLAQSYAGYPVHDALSTVSQRYRDQHPDFELYRKLARYQRENQDASELRGEAGWGLDKWKFLPMLFRAFEAAPEGVEWFVMIEADTSLSWTNLLQWLKTMRADRPWYLGAQNQIGDSTFAHGGSGVIISRKAAKLLQAVREEEGKEEYDQRWESLTTRSCCGDEIIARAFVEASVPLTPSWPIIQGETMVTLDWTANHWCSPAITWHHVSPIELDALWQFQTQWVNDHGWETPYLYRDVFAHFIQRHITVNRTSWNNMSQDRKLAAAQLTTDENLPFYSLNEWEQQAVESEDACASICENMDQCVQWMWSPGRCHLGYVVRFGKSDEREAEHWTSGWMGDRVEVFEKRFEGCKVKWTGLT